MIVPVREASHLLQQGQVVAIPTETVYGLAARIDNIDAIKKIFSTKARPFFDPLIVHISNFSQLTQVTESISESANLLAKNLWPGPLTLILKKHHSISDLITAGLPDVGVRFPKHALAQELINDNGPLAAPSANKFGKTSPTQAQHVENEFQGQVAVVDGGNCNVGIESTVLKIEELPDKVNVIIVRPGSYGEQEIRVALSSQKKEIHFIRSGSLAAPGQLENHYQPDAPLVLSGSPWTPKTHQNIEHQLQKKYSTPPVFWKWEAPSPELVARRLYASMREHSVLAAKSNTYIYLETPLGFQDKAWEALRDRLNKASSLSLD